MKTRLLSALILVGTIAYAQGNPLELLRQDLKTQKVAIMTASLPLTDKQAEKFWPIYREYSDQLAKLGDRRIAVIKEFADRYSSIDEKTASKLVKESISIANDRNKLLDKYYAKVAKTIDGITAARFIQVENQMLTLLDAQIVSQMPLVKAPPAAADTAK